MTLAPATTWAPAPTHTSPEEALATPGAFLAWLLEAQEQGHRTVGHSNSPTRCPLATFARRHLGLRVPAVCCGSLTDVRGGLCLYYRRGAHEGPPLPLPGWCLQFVLRVDEAPVRVISPRRALRILGEVLTNQEYAPATEGDHHER